MRTRSTRLFVILLHLVGCRPRQFYFQLPAQGIVGVQPWPIVLERLDLANLLFPNQQHSTQIDAEEEEEAVWLQNDQGRCLGPTARFTDCGDASLWFIAKRKLPRRRKFLQMGIFAADEDSSAVTTSAKEGLVFYVVDRDVEGTPAWNAGPAQEQHRTTTTTTTTTRGPWWKRVFWKPQRSSSNKRHQKECLIHQPDGHVTVAPCSKKVSWGWEMDTNGALKPLYLAEPNHDACLWSTVALGSCRDERTVHLTVVRYRAVSLPDALQHLSMNKEEAASSSSSSPSPSSFPMAATTTVMDKKLTGAHAPTPTTQNNNNNNQKATNLPSRKRDLAHMHASEPAQQRHLKNSSKPSLSRAPQEAATEESRSNGLSPVRLLHRASPVVHAVEKTFQASAHKTSQSGTASSSLVSSVAPSAPHRTRKIPVHPYIAAAKDEVWTDPSTGLQYPTDLSGYLGQDRTERGRSTLMGVGQYRKGYVIKVYGIAYYVSKRDVLADPFFADYANLSADELKARPEFYEHLRLQAENFERTIVIKINMQLAADTIRNSLHADWKMLTEEAKDTLIGSSLQPRPASPKFLEFVADQTNNPGRCSCGQVCPEEYDADLDCCARGTELAFTWLKSGDLEVRLNGELMETFPRPDIAEGILFEYLRYDDPISPEFRDNVVQGFPFLLAPLAQVKGAQVPKSKPTSTSPSLPPHKALWQFLENSQAGFMEWASEAPQAALEALSQPLSAATHTVEQGAHHLLQEANRKRLSLIQQIQGLPQTVRAVLTSTSPSTVVNDTLLLEVEEDPATGRLARLLLDHAYPDEIGPPVREVHPQSQIYLLLVHLYLLLLLIVSFPNSYSIKLTRRKKSHKSRSSIPLKPKGLSYYL